jgi:co-chaperonin GroES (HSP10)
MIRVPGHRILLKLPEVTEQLQDPVSEDLKKLGFQVYVEKELEGRHKAASQFGKVVAVGPLAWQDPALGFGSPNWEPWCKEGDTIIFARYSGKFIEDPTFRGEKEGEFYIINDVDVQAVVVEE